MPSQLVKRALGFDDPKTKCVPLSLEFGSEQGARDHGAPLMSRALVFAESKVESDLDFLC